MKSTATFLILSLSLLTACGGPKRHEPAHPGVIEGTIVDEVTKKPVLASSVWIVGTTLGDMSNLDGEFEIRNVPSGEYTLRISNPLYETEELPAEVTLSQRKCRIKAALKAKDIKATVDSMLNDSRSPYEQGRSMAEEDLRRGSVKIFAYGLPSHEYPLHVDTGLGIPVIQMGCIITDFDEDFRKGYRETLEEYIEKIGKLPNSRKEWINDILEPKGFFERMAREQVVLSGSALQDTIGAPADDYSICLTYNEWHPVVRVMGPYGERDTPVNFTQIVNTEFVFGPPESYLLIMKSDDKYVGKDGYCVIDYQFGGIIGW